MPPTPPPINLHKSLGDFRCEIAGPGPCLRGSVRLRLLSEKLRMSLSQVKPVCLKRLSSTADCILSPFSPPRGAVQLLRSALLAFVTEFALRVAADWACSLLTHRNLRGMLVRGVATLRPAAASARKQTRAAHVCVVGSGPSGFYTTKYLLKASPHIRVDLIDDLPTPYGASSANARR
jgi:hypothetical protein